MVQKIQKGNLLKIPAVILKRMGLHPGDCVEISDDGYRIIITPKVQDEDYTAEEIAKLEMLAKEKGGRTFKSGEALLAYLDKLSK